MPSTHFQPTLQLPQDPPEKALVLYHANCTDGFTAAYVHWLSRQRRGEEGKDDMYVPVDYGRSGFASPKDGASRVLYILDFSYHPEYLVNFAKYFKRVVQLDHHVTAKTDWEKHLLDPALLADVTECTNLHVKFDMHKSGAGLAWEYFFPEAPESDLVKYVQDRDLWKFAQENSKAISARIAQVGKSFQNYRELDFQLSTPVSKLRLVQEGKLLNEAFLSYVDKMCEETVTAKIGGIEMPLVNCHGIFASDVGNLLSQRSTSGAAATFFLQSDGMYKFSLRSDGRVNVAELCQKYGGGGHAKASGFRAHPWQLAQMDCVLIVEEQ